MESGRLVFEDVFRQKNNDTGDGESHDSAGKQSTQRELENLEENFSAEQEAYNGSYIGNKTRAEKPIKVKTDGEEKDGHHEPEKQGHS
jgi:hypothetical protein